MCYIVIGIVIWIWYYLYWDMRFWSYRTAFMPANTKSIFCSSKKHWNKAPSLHTRPDSLYVCQNTAGLNYLHFKNAYSLNLSRHGLFHMARSLKQPTSTLAGVGRAMLEKGLELMLMRGVSFFRAGRWLSCTRPYTSSRHSMGNVFPRSVRAARWMW